MAFAKTKKALANMVTLAHPDPSKTFTLFPDASHRSWGSVLTQVEPASTDLPVAEQDHQPLAFLSGAFKGASLRWSTTEKEAYAIVASCKRLDYLLQRPGGFTICTDHRNLRYIFGQEPDLKQPRYLAEKLARWAMILDTFTYDIRHIPGEANVWGTSSPGGATPRRSRPLDAQVEGAAVWSDGQRHVMKRLVRLPLPTPSPLAADFEWPSWDSIRRAKQEHEREASQLGPVLIAGQDGVLRLEGRVWVPLGALELQLSLLGIAHAGAMGHRGMKASRRSKRRSTGWVFKTTQPLLSGSAFSADVSRGKWYPARSARRSTPWSRIRWCIAVF